MRWPFVRRESYERMRVLAEVTDSALQRVKKERDAELLDWARRYDDSTGFLQARCSDWAARYDKLLNKYHALRVKGANAEPEKPTIQPPPPLTAVDYAIERVTAKASPLRKAALERHLRGIVAQEKAKQGYDEESMAERIEHWQETAD